MEDEVCLSSFEEGLESRVSRKRSFGADDGRSKALYAGTAAPFSPPNLRQLSFHLASKQVPGDCVVDVHMQVTASKEKTRKGVLSLRLIARSIDWSLL